MPVLPSLDGLEIVFGEFSVFRTLRCAVSDYQCLASQLLREVHEFGEFRSRVSSHVQTYGSYMTRRPGHDVFVSYEHYFLHVRELSFLEFTTR